MDGTGFDAWTRRQFGLAAGSAAASLIGLARIDRATARKKRRNKHKKRKKRRACTPFGEACDPESTRACCQNSLCTTFNGSGPDTYFCGGCKNLGKTCKVSDECCASLGLACKGRVCCHPIGDSCANDGDCCQSDGLTCFSGVCVIGAQP